MTKIVTERPKWIQGPFTNLWDPLMEYDSLKAGSFHAVLAVATGHIAPKPLECYYDTNLQWDLYENNIVVQRWIGNDGCTGPINEPIIYRI